MRNQIRKFAFIASVLFASLSMTSCDDDEIQAEETPEAITEVSLTFSNPNILNNPVATATDADRDGLNFTFSPDTIELMADSTYTLDITFLDGTESITDEIKEEADEHQIFLTSTNVISSITYADTENDYVSDGCTACANSTEVVGLKNTVKVSATKGITGTLTIRLKHQPDGLKTGSVDSGEDDVNLTFNVKAI